MAARLPERFALSLPRVGARPPKPGKVRTASVSGGADQKLTAVSKRGGERGHRPVGEGVLEIGGPRPIDADRERSLLKVAGGAPVALKDA